MFSNRFYGRFYDGLFFVLPSFFSSIHPVNPFITPSKNLFRLNSFIYIYLTIDYFFYFACSLIIFPQAGPDVKYFLGFLRTQLSTTTTVVLVFGPKVLRVLRGQGDQWDHRARVRGITASFSLNGIGLVPEDSPDLYQENEELKVRYWKCTRKNIRLSTVASKCYFSVGIFYSCSGSYFVKSM